MDFLKWKREKRERDTERQGRRETEGGQNESKERSVTAEWFPNIKNKKNLKSG